MKRLVLICVLCALILPVASAQSVSIGAKIGGGPAFFGGSDWQDGLDLLGGNNEIRMGVTGGLFLNIKIDWFSIQPELVYSLLGGAFSIFEPALFEDIDFKITANVLELPILLMPRYRAGEGEVRIFFGPALIIILDDIEIEGEVFGVAVSMDVEPDNKCVFGIKGGIGYAQPLGRGAAVVDCCYTRSLTEIFEDDNTAVNSLMLTVGYQTGF